MKKVYKVYVDTTVIPCLKESLLGFAKSLESDGMKPVIIATLDNKELRERPEELAKVAEVHGFYPSVLDQVKDKPMYFSSIGEGVTVPAGKIGDFIHAAEEVAARIDAVAISKDRWDCGYKWVSFSSKKLESIGLPANANRSMVKERCEEIGNPDFYTEFCNHYLVNMARQHGCDAYIDNNGEVVLV